ncbi:hypothetical protein ACFZ8E_11610 [Methylobacterium sp. HMF5984]|uniref:hypothetical protein n=1 Tax=Methylobacterium sp. HMF5984 TaxID=3367370 RepID=UPI003851B4A3
MAEIASAGTPNLLQDLRSVASEMADKWDAGMKAGKLLAHLEGRISNYDPRVSRIIAALEATDAAHVGDDTPAKETGR